MKKQIHVVDNLTGYCSTCNKYENTDVLSTSYLQIGKILVNDGESKNLTPVTNNKKETPLRPETVLRFRRYQYLDLCKGKLGEKYKSCQLCETLHYYPLWCITLITILLLSSIAAATYLSYYYTYKSVILKSYTQSCSSTEFCDTSKGLFCKTNTSNGVYEDSCNCPALGVVNTCDCPTTSYWNGITCSPVFSYEEGECSGNYSCYKGLICDTYTAKCMCPDETPVWDSKAKKCGYKYIGCYNCTDLTKKLYDFDPAEIYLMAQANTMLELDDCIAMCKAFNKRFVHMIYYQYLKCGCSNSSTAVTKVDNTFCNYPCSFYSAAKEVRCPASNQYSTFQIGL